MELQTNSELDEIKKDCCKAYMVTYQNSDSIKSWCASRGSSGVSSGLLLTDQPNCALSTCIKQVKVSTQFFES